MKTRDTFNPVLERLEALEVQVSELKLLVDKLVKWTGFQEGKGDGRVNDKKTGDDDKSRKQDTSVLDKKGSVAKGKGRVRIGPKSRVIKNETDVNEDFVKGKDADLGELKKTKTAARRKGIVAIKSTSGVPKRSSNTTDLKDSSSKDLAISRDEVSIKEESTDFAEFMLCPSSPAASVGGTSFVLEIQGGNEQEDSADGGNDNNDGDFVVHMSSEDDEDDYDEESGDEEFIHTDEAESENDDSQKEKKTLKRKYAPRKPNYSKDNPKPKRIYRYRGPKVIVQPLSSRTKPPFVRLNRIDGVTLKEKYGIEEPSPRGPRKYPCPRCDKVFSKVKDMWAHKKTHPKVYKRYTCEFCQKVHASKSKHFEHVNTHTGARPFLCDICGFASKARSSLKAHIKLIHVETERKFQCEICALMLKSKNYLKIHMKLKHTEPEDLEPHVCDECGAVFKIANKLQRHKKEIHEAGRRFQCQLCDKSFKRPQHLADHKSRHDAGIKRRRMLKDEYDKRKKELATTMTGDKPISEVNSAVEGILPPESDPLYIGVAEEDMEQETQKISQIDPEPPTVNFVIIPSTNSDVVQD